MLTHHPDAYVLEQSPAAMLQRIARVVWPASMLAAERLTDKPVEQTPSVSWSYYVDQAIMSGKCGNFQKSQEFWLAALEVANCFDQKDGRTAYTLDSLMHSYCTVGKLLDAQVYGERALWTIQAVYGKKHIFSINCMNTLAGVYYDQGKFAESEVLAVQVLTEYNKKLGPTHPQVGVACTNLAMLYQQQGKFGLAELMYERAMPICKRELGTVDKKIGALLENYATVLDELGHMARAEQVRAEMRCSGVWHMFSVSSHQRLTA